MNKLGKTSILLIAIFLAGNSVYPINQMVNAQLEILENPPSPANTSTTKPVDVNPVDAQKNEKVKQALANIFEIYQVLAERGDVDLLLKLNTIERILLELLR